MFQVRSSAQIQVRFQSSALNRTKQLPQFVLARGGVLKNSVMTGATAGAEKLLSCPGRYIRFALGSAPATVATASFKGAGLFSPPMTRVGMVTDVLRSRRIDQSSSSARSKRSVCATDLFFIHALRMTSGMTATKGL